MKTAKVARLDYNRRRKHYVKVALLEEHPSGAAYKLLAEVSKNFYVARVREQTGGAFIDKLLLDEVAPVTEALVRRVVAVDLTTKVATLRYALDSGFVEPIGRERRYIATLRLNKSDETAINV